MTEVKTSPEELIKLLSSPTKEDEKMIRNAYALAQKAHEGHTRFTGEPYFNHVFETARVLAELHMDPATVAAGLLHDAVEDGGVTPEEIHGQVGEEVLFLVKGVTKLGKLKYRGLERHVESLRKLFIATAQDIRVLIIKLADRLHNVKTLHGHPKPEKQKRIALETLEIYVPLADRLGIGQLKGELEDYAFKYAYPKEYEETRALLKQKSTAGQKRVEKIQRTLRKKLAGENIKIEQLDYRVKRIHSLYRKLIRKNMDIEKIHDVVALRVVVPTVEDCYRVLGVVHNTWRPLPGRIKDYIALPKLNGYQSLHTTVFTGDGGLAEIQIRTVQMHDEAEYGVASHLGYKEGGKGVSLQKKKEFEKQHPWVQQLLEWQKNVSESKEFLKYLRLDFFKDRVFVFTPQGDVIDLPLDASPIDFAYAIHTDIGNHISGAKVNGKMASLDTSLQSGDIVEIQTNKKARPSGKWLKMAKTTLARRSIRQALQNQSTSFKDYLPSFGDK